jgi:hypothetical protein
MDGAIPFLPSVPSWHAMRQLFPTDVHAAVNVGQPIVIGIVD